MNETLHTKYGTAKLNNGNYYQITSRTEGNKNKLLHRVIWEEFYGRTIPKGYDIHHINGDKFDFRIQNLQCVEHKAHMRFHIKTESNETKDKRNMNTSKARNNSGYYRVYLHKCKDCKQGFIYRYQYYENGKQKPICSVDIDKLEAKVKAKGLPWFKLFDVEVEA